VRKEEKGKTEISEEEKGMERLRKRLRPSSLLFRAGRVEKEKKEDEGK